MKILSEKIEFPDVDSATSQGLLAIGGDLRLERLLLAYKSGIFPWYEDGQPILWWSPDPRFVLFPENLKISKSLKQAINKSKFDITINKSFQDVIEACASTKRPGQRGTWLTKEMIDAYINLHKSGYALSVEVWEENKLVGGLYGVDAGNGVFCGESMFSRVSNVSKIGFVHFIQNTNYKLIDCQIYTKHLKSFGADYIPRNQFIDLINDQKNFENLKF